jgi:hypothetical protein
MAELSTALILHKKFSFQLDSSLQEGIQTMLTIQIQVASWAAVVLQN